MNTCVDIEANCTVPQLRLDARSLAHFVLASCT